MFKEMNKSKEKNEIFEVMKMKRINVKNFIQSS